MAISTHPARPMRLALALIACVALTACATPRYPSRATGPQVPGTYKVGKPYQVGGVWYVPREQPGYDVTGVASWYGDAFHQKTTANGEVFDMNLVSAAHTTLPLPSLVEVTNLGNGRRLVVRVNDRGPFVGDRIIDLSREAARQLGYDRAGLARVRVRYVGPAPLTPPGAGFRYAQAEPLPARKPPAALDRLPSDPVMALAAGSPVSPPAATAAPLAPNTGRAILDTPITSAPLAGLPPPPAAASALRIQAGAFSSEANAQRAVAQLAPEGRASIDTIERDGAVLYRVTLPAPDDEAAAFALRDHIAEIGFADALVVRTF